MNMECIDSLKLTHIGEAIDFDLDMLDLVVDFEQTEGDLELLFLIGTTVYYDTWDEPVEPKKEDIHKSYALLADKIFEIINKDFVFPEELEQGIKLWGRTEKENKILSTTYPDSTGKRYSLAIIYLGYYIVASFYEVALDPAIRELKQKGITLKQIKSKKDLELTSKLQSKSKSKFKPKSKFKGFGKK